MSLPVLKENEENKENKANKKRKIDDDYSRGWSGKKLSEKYTTKAQVQARLRKVERMVKGNQRKLAQIKKRLGALRKENERLNKLHETLAL